MPIQDPTWTFFIVLSVILFAPMLMHRLRIPSIVGMIIAGVLIGKYGFNILERDDSFKLFGKVGVYYIMFLASLEMNMQDVKSIQKQYLTLGLLSFLFPVLLGFTANYYIMGYGIMAAVLMAAMYASHTLISYPIVMRYGIARRKSVSIATGGTIVADVLTLLVLAGVTGMLDEDASNLHMLYLALKVMVVGATILFIFPRVGQWVFRRYDEVVVQYIFVLSMVFLGAGLMEIAGIEGILGAFLVGIALNRLIPPSSPLMSHIEFIGNSIFIPYFLIGVGMMINIQTFMDYRQTLPLAAIMIIVATMGKWLAAFVTQKAFHLSRNDRKLMFGLTSSRAAATLAVVLAGYELKVVDDTVLNATMLLILFTCIISSFATEHTARDIALNEKDTIEEVGDKDQILVALSNPETVQPLMNAALMLRSKRDGTQISAVAVVLENDSARRTQTAKQLEQAKKIAAAANVGINTYNRWAVNITTGIYHTMMEIGASELLIGLHQKTRLSDSFFGKFTSDILASVQQQVVVFRPIVPLNTMRRIHLLVPKRAEFERGFQHWLNRVAGLAEQLSCTVEAYATPPTIKAMEDYCAKHKLRIVLETHDYNTWNDLSPIVHRTRPDHLFIVVMARTATLSYHKYMERIPDQVERYFSTRDLMIIFPDQISGSTTASTIRSGVPVNVR